MVSTDQIAQGLAARDRAQALDAEAAAVTDMAALAPPIAA
jgi:hypothetical protein